MKMGWAAGGLRRASATGRGVAPRAARSRTLVVAVGLLVAATACAGGVERDESGAISSRQTIPVAELQPGDCFDLPDGTAEVGDIAAVPCDEPHDAEVFHSYDLPDAEQRPDSETIAVANRDACVPAFEGFVDHDFESSDLDILTLDPSEESWREGDRTVICSIVAVDRSPLTGTAQGAAR
jgi:hypothetical protein